MNEALTDFYTVNSFNLKVDFTSTSAVLGLVYKRQGECTWEKAFARLCKLNMNNCNYDNDTTTDKTATVVVTIIGVCVKIWSENKAHLVCMDIIVCTVINYILQREIITI